MNTENLGLSKQIDAETHPDLKIIFPMGNTVKKEQLVELQEEFNKKSLTGNRRVYIITEADKLNISSSNSILKFLEEPVSGVTAILIVNNRYQLIETILSRCQIISLNKINNTSEKTVNKLIDLTKFNDMSESIYENNAIEVVLNFIEFFEKNKLSTLPFINKNLLKFYKNKDDLSQVLMGMIYFYMDVLNKMLDRKISVYNEYMEIIENISNMNTTFEVIKKIECLNKARNNLSSNANISLVFDKLIIDMVGGK